MSSSALPLARPSEVWKVLVQVSRGNRPRLASALVLGTISASLLMVGPITIGRLVDAVERQTADFTTVVMATVVMAGSLILSALGLAVAIVLAAYTYHAMLAALRERLFERGMLIPQGVVERAGTGDFISRTSDDVSEIADAAPLIIPAIAASGFTIAVTITSLSVMDWRYGLALLILLPVYILTIRWYAATAPGVYRDERVAMSMRAQQVVESQHGFETIRGLGLGEQRNRSVLNASWAVAGPALRATTVRNIFFGRLNFAEYLGTAAILVTGFWLIGAGQSTIGGVMAAVLLFTRLFGPINQLLLIADVLQSVLASLERMVGVIIMEVPPEQSGTDASSVQVKNVSFSYDGSRRVLDDVDLTIDRGSRVAIVGATGAGKTTLAAVIAGIHQPTSGEVSKPRQTVVITQEVHVFSGTLRENLTLASPQARDDEIHRALETTGALDFYGLGAQGLDTIVGAAGNELTAAQAQQLALARLVLADPELAILDEATAEAGSSHSELLDSAAGAALRGRTGIVIAHRLSQAANCDAIVVMDRGRIVARGTHDELVTQGGLYADLWDAWTVGRSRI